MGEAEVHFAPSFQVLAVVGSFSCKFFEMKFNSYISSLGNNVKRSVGFPAKVLYIYV